MKYNELEQLKNTLGAVCLFGAGLIGSTWAYDLLSAMGFQIDYYCDNNKKENIVIRDEVKTISLETLYSFQNNVLVFITVITKYQNSIRAQLERNGINNVICVDFHFLCTFLDSLVEMNDKDLNEKFRAVLDDAEYLKKQFEYRLGYHLNLEHPRTFNEKIQWLKLYDRKPEYVQMVDKYEAKQFVKERIGSGYTVPTLGIWDSFDEIDFDKLPDQFVLKCTHDSGSIVIVDDKENLDKEEAKKTLNTALQINYFWIGREWPYKNVNRRIIAEPYLKDIAIRELIDYRFFCFGGKVKAIFVDYDHTLNHIGKRNIYSSCWEYIPLSVHYPTEQGKKIEKPKCLEDMIDIAEKLATSIPHVRVDFYIIDNRPLVGEITFFHAGGMQKFIPQEWDKIFGDWIVLPEKE